MPSPDDALVDASLAAPAATAIPSGPPPSSDAPGAVQEPLGQSGSDAQAAEKDLHPKAFDMRHRQPFEGLMYLGRLEDSFQIWGHTFRIATPSQMERLQSGEVHAPFVGTMAAEIAYQTIVVASYLTEVDGRELPRPITNDPKENALRDRFKWVAENLKSQVIDRIYERCLILESQVEDVLDAMGEAQG